MNPLTLKYEWAVGVGGFLDAFTMAVENNKLYVTSIPNDPDQLGLPFTVHVTTLLMVLTIALMSSTLLIVCDYSFMVLFYF